MTIVTKPLSEKKQDTLKKPLVPVIADQNGNAEDVEARFVIPPRSFRVSNATLLCLFLTSLLTLGVGIMGGVYLYRHYGRPQIPVHRVQGTFQLPRLGSEALYQSQMFPLESDNSMEEIRRKLRNLTERFEIDMADDSEKIVVPDFGMGRRGRFIHDFNANKTGILDIQGGRCFVMHLNRNRVLPPRSMYDLITKIWDGYYEVDTEIVRETYKVELPAITSPQDMGKFIYRECANLPTYRLKRIRNSVFKRSVPAMEEFSEFAGKKVTNFCIIMDGIEEAEDMKKH